MEQVLLVVQVLIAVALIGMVLIQRSESDGFGLGGGSGNNLLSGRGVANLMTRTTAILAALFMLNSLALSVMAARGHAPSIAEQIEKDQGNGAPVVPVAGDESTKAISKKAEKDAKEGGDKAKKEAKPEIKPEVKDEISPKAKDEVTDAEKAAEPVKKAAPKKVKKAVEATPAEPTNTDEADHNNE